MNDPETSLPIPVIIDQPITVKGKKRWPIALGATVGALLPVALELGMLGPQVARDVRQACLVLVGAPHVHGIK
jgi:hypothetical protein